MEKSLKQNNLNNMQCQSECQQQSSHKCCKQSNQMCSSQLNQLVHIIRQRYISPYKIIYMINQQQADLFKLRNQNSGCCSSSAITIPKHQMTKTQLFLSEAINQSLKISNLNIILEQMSDKFENIVKSGQKQNLKVDQNVQKFLVQKVLSESFNLHLFKIVTQRLKKQSESFSNSAMLWATPNTWLARYPSTPLNFLSSNTLSSLNSESKRYGFQKDFLLEYKDNLLKQLRLLEQDGKFQQLLWNKNFSNVRNDLKALIFPENYAFDGSQQSYREGQIIYPYLKKSLLTLRSIPFELNSKLKSYCTISQNNQISYFKKSLIYAFNSDVKSQYSTLCPIFQANAKDNNKLKVKIINKKTSEAFQQKIIKSGELIIIDNTFCDIQLSGDNIEEVFIFKSWIFTLPKNK